MDALSGIQFFLIFAAVLVVHFVWAKRRINQWASRNNYNVLKCKICLINIGPSSYFGTSGGQSVFKIEVENHEGKIRTGYARAGGFFFGLLRERVEVKWDKSLLDEYENY